MTGVNGVLSHEEEVERAREWNKALMEAMHDLPQPEILPRRVTLHCDTSGEESGISIDLPSDSSGFTPGHLQQFAAWAARYELEMVSGDQAVVFRPLSNQEH